MSGEDGEKPKREWSVREVDLDRVEALCRALNVEDIPEFERVLESVMDDSDLTPFDSTKNVVGALCAQVIQLWESGSALHQEVQVLNFRDQLREDEGGVL